MADNLMRTCLAILSTGFLLAAPGATVAPPPLLYSAFLKHGPIVTGIVDSLGTLPSGESSLSLSVSEVLRGDPLPPKITISYIIEPQDLRHPAVLWNRVSPAAGKHLLVFLQGQSPVWTASEVLDLDQSADAQWVPVVRRMITLDSNGSRASLISALDDPLSLIRSLAMFRLLDSVCRTDLPCKQQILEKMKERVNSPASSPSAAVEAVGVIGLRIYDGSDANARINQYVLRDLLGFVVSPIGEVRSEAIQILGGYFLGTGVAKPNMPNLTAAERASIVRVLEDEARNNRELSGLANGLAHLLSQQ